MSIFDLMDDEAVDRVRKAATAAKTKLPAFLRFDSGVWTAAGIDVTGATWLALPDLATAGWKRFENRQVVEERMTLISEHGIPPRPDSFNDRESWRTGSGGRPMDPWSKQLALPLLNESTEKIAVFTASSVDGKIAIGEILDDFANRRRQVVTLSSETVRVDGKDVHEPKFVIVEHSEHDAAIPGFVAEKTVVAPAKANGGSVAESDYY
jgi:hypothetical protein